MTIPYLVQSLARIAAELVDWQFQPADCPLCTTAGENADGQSGRAPTPCYVRGLACSSCRGHAGMTSDPFGAHWPYRAYA